MADSAKKKDLVVLVGLGKKPKKKDGGKVEGHKAKGHLGKYSRGGKSPEYKDQEEKDQPEQETAWDKYADGGATNGKWIKGATKNKGALHRALGVPEGEKIPEKKLSKAEHSENPRIRKEASLAKTLKKMN